MDRNILVLARRDPNEAMRVAAGLTIFGHSVVLVMLSDDFDQTSYEKDFEDLLELAEIEPVTTTKTNIGQFSAIQDQTLTDEVIKAEAVISV